jgi:signal transduction histidine kinase
VTAQTGPTTFSYRLWPRYSPGTVELGGAGLRPLLRMGGALALGAAVLATPPLVSLTGLSAPIAVGLFAAYFLCMVVNDFVLHPLAMRSRAGFNLQLAIVPLYNVAFCAAFVIIPGDPKSPLWMALLLYACTTGTWQEIDASLALLALHVAAPLATIPFFVARGAAVGWSVSAPALCAIVSGLAYHSYAMLGETWRQVRRQQAATIDSLRARAVELHRQELARDLHDSVGSALAVAVLYGDLIERNLDRPDELRLISATLREAGRDGLGELRGVLDALEPADATLDGLATDLGRLARRVTAASGAEVSVATTGDVQAELDGRVRLVLVRVFQESLNNAIRHGHSRLIHARLAVLDRQVTLEVQDDGSGFDPSAAPGTGRGVRGMSARAQELGGRWTLGSSPGRGTRVSITLPMQAPIPS